MGLLELPYDVQCGIWTQLSLKEINRLRQTCTALATGIQENKHLWVHIFSQEVRARSLRIPSDLQDIESVNARDIESWVKHAILLESSYRTPSNKLSVRTIDIRQGLRVTWLKLILGRWCLVAAANDEESELSLWQVFPGGVPCILTKIYLDAPIMDGKVDCSTGPFRCAITVGATHPYILVLGAHQSGNSIILRELAHIPNASHVQFFEGEMIGFAVRNGDDAYPYVANWMTGDLFCLRVPDNATPPGSSPFPIEACKAILIKNRLVFTLHHTSVQVFRERDVTENSSQSPPDHVASLLLETTISHGQFLGSITTGPDKEGGRTVIRIILQDELSELHQVAVIVDSDAGDADAYHVQMFSIKQPPDLPSVRTLHLFHLGSSGRTFFCVTSISACISWTPALLLASLRPTTTARDPLQVDGEYIPVSSTGLPLVHILSAVDFDDENGLLLLGTTIGDVRLASVLSRPVITPSSMKATLSRIENLGSTPARISNVGATGLYLHSCTHRYLQVPIPLDLPLFYSIRKNYRVFYPLPQDVIRRVVSEWGDSRLGAFSLFDWTNDWTKSEYLWDWILPLSRWGPLDDDFTDPAVSEFVRIRLQALGEIIPILYCIHNHRQVVFRIGNSMFFCMLVREDEHDVDIFLTHEDGFLGVLPLPYDQFLNDPASIFPSLWNYGTQTNLDSRTPPADLTQRAYVAGAYLDIRAYLDSIGKGDISVAEMETWSNDNWDYYANAAREASRDPDD